MARRGRPKHPGVLTPREQEVLELIRAGLSNEQIAERLSISFATAKFHVSEIIGKLGVRDRREAALWQPDAPGAPSRQPGWLAPLSMLRHVPRVVTPAVSAALVGIAAVAVALLAWGVMASRDGTRLASVRAPATIAADHGCGQQVATEAGIVPWTTLRISGGDLPHPITVPFTEYLLATDLGRQSWVGAPTAAPAPIITRYRVQFVCAGDGATPVGAAGAYAGGPAQRLQPPNIGASAAAPQSWQQAPPVLAALLDRYIALGDAVTDQPTLGQSIYATQRRAPTSVSVAGRALSDADAGTFLSLLGDSSPMRFGLRGRGVGQRALKAATVDVRLDTETLTFSYIPPGPVAPYGLLMSTPEVDVWEVSALLDPPAYAQHAYSVPKQLDDLMAGLGFVGGAPVENADTRIIPLLDADMTMRIDHVTVSDGTQDVSVDGVDPDRTDCAPGVDVCDHEAATLPANAQPLTLTVSRRGVDPFPEAQRPAEYSYYPPATAGARGVLVQTKAGAIWNATSGRDGGTPYYASAATDDALRAAVRQLAGQPPEPQATLTQ
jgi:DNA-binding CsgD family transcriptional regulator